MLLRRTDGPRPVPLWDQPVLTCSCCGEPRDESETAALQCHQDIRICRACIGWLAQSSGMLDVTPTFPVVNMDDAIRFYEAAGFNVHRYDDGFAFVRNGDDSIFDLDLVDHIDPAHNGAGCYMIVPNVEQWNARFRATGMPVSNVESKPWGMREFSVRDPSGNNLRIGQNL